MQRVFGRLIGRLAASVGWLAERWARRRRALVACALAAASVAGLLAHPAVEFSRIRYARASYHFDSAGYRWRGVEASRRLHSDGLPGAAWKTLQEKDSLTVLLRLLVAPWALTLVYGHLAIALPILWVFLFLLAEWVHSRSGSLPLALLVCTPILVFPSVYRPHMGLADCVPEASGVGLLGIVLVCWVRAQGLTRAGWAAAGGLALALLLWQRTVMAYFAMLILVPPALVAIACPRTTRRHALRVLAAMLAPVAASGLGLAAAQAATLYRYYAVAGYGYQAPAEVLRFLLDFAGSWALPGVLLCLGAALAAGPLRAPGQGEPGAAWTAAWFVVGLPLAVAGSRAVYAGFVWCWIPALMLLPAALAGGGRGWRANVAATVLAAGTSAALPFAHASVVKEPVPQVWLEARPFFDAVIRSLPERPLRVQLLVNEWDVLLQNQAFFDAGRRGWSRGPALISQHDSYYRERFGALPPEEIARLLAEALEGGEEMWAVAYCDSEAVERTPTLISDGPHVALPTLRLLNEHVRTSPDWLAVRTIDMAPTGCVTLYRYQPGRRRER